MPLFWFSLAFLCGILLASQVTLSTITWLAISAVTLLFTIILRWRATRRNIPYTPLQTLAPIALIVIFLGGARYQASIPEITPDFIAWYNDRQEEIRLTGTLSEPPDYRDSYTYLRLQVDSVKLGDEAPLPVHGMVLARVRAGMTYHYGDQLRLGGYLKIPPENEEFSFRDYLARQGIHSYMSGARVTILPVGESGGNPILKAVYAFKERALSNLYKILPDPQASLLAGILLGVDPLMSAEMQQAFKNTGTAHIIVISGFNITIIAGFLMAIFNRLFGLRRGGIVAAAGIAIYTVLVGADPAVVRAALIGGLSMFALQVGRRQNGLNSLAFIAALMAFFNPHLPWDVGFQLSFFATLGLILYAEPFSQAFIRLASRWLPSERAQRLAGPVGMYVLFTLAAQLTTLPVVAYHFGRISLVSLVANPFILPAQPAVMILGGLSLLFSLIYLPLGKLAAMFTWPFVAYTIRTVQLFDRLPHGVLVLGEFSLLFAIFFYAILFAWTFFPGQVKSLRTKLTPAIILTALAILTILTWRAAYAAPDGRLHLTFLDVGSADAVLIQTPAGRHVLVNGGPSAAHLSDALGRRLSPFQRRLDWLVLASTQEDQVAALPRTMQRFPPVNVLWSGKAESSYSAGELERWLIDQRIPLTQAEPGHALDLGNGARLTVLTSGPRGAVLLLEWGNFRLLLPIGINFDALEEFKYGKAIGQVSVLLLAESGYAPVNPPEWIKALRPQLIVLDVMAGDQDSLPAPETLEAVKGYSLLRTDLNGWIHISTDGEQMWVEVERK